MDLQWQNQTIALCEITPLTLQLLSSSGSTFEGGEVEAYTLVKSIDYPRNPVTGEITAAVHSQLQVQYKMDARFIV